MSKKDTKVSNIRSADDLIIKDEAAKLGKPISEAPKAVEQQEAQPQEVPVIEANNDQNKPESSENQKEQTEVEPLLESSEKETQEDNELDAKEPSEEEIDDYGTKVPKKKLYTEEEVQRMIRERLSRGKNNQQQQDIQNAAKDFTPDPASDESWETQLESFVEKTIHKLSKKATDNEWRQHEEASQAEFEIKFSEGMTKYQDFSTVVGNKPITNAMMLATRSMKDPAAFLYAACKQQPKELARIAEIKDAVTQATEIGRLEERMKKTRALPSSPKPATRISGDASSEMPQLSIEARIAAHAKTKIMR
jgi:hypothetical protein